MTKPEFLFAKDKMLVTLATISVTILSPGLPIIYLTSKHWKVVLGVYFDLSLGHINLFLLFVTLLSIG